MEIALGQALAVGLEIARYDVDLRPQELGSPAGDATGRLCARRGVRDGGARRLVVFWLRCGLEPAETAGDAEVFLLLLRGFVQIELRLAL